jgi:hypothetical protein
MPHKGPYHRHQPIFRLPTPGEGGWPATDDSLHKMQQHLQTAVLIELTTIPLYLYAAYSIKDDPKAVYKIIGEHKLTSLSIQRAFILTYNMAPPF